MSPAPDKLEIYLCRTPEDLAVVHSVRFKVFVDEEKLHKTNADQLDEKDEASDHFLLLKNGVAIGTVRWYPPLCKLGRMAVLNSGRGVGAGRLLCDALEEHVIMGKGKAGPAQIGLKEITIVASSRQRAQGFYEKIGYKAETEGTYYIEDGEPHIKMLKTVQLVQ